MTRYDDFDVKSITSDMRDIWSLLDSDEQQIMLDALAVYKFKRNEIIYHEGDSPDNLLCLISGKVKIYRDGFGGRSLINRVLRPVQYFGYRASMANEPYVTAAAAIDDSVVVMIPMARLYAVMLHNNRLCSYFIRALAVDLGLADKRIVSLTQKHIRARLAESLLSLIDVYGFENDGVTLNSQILREDMANLSNMTTSNAIRTLMGFADEGIIEVHGRKIKLLRMDQLKEISENG